MSWSPFESPALEIPDAGWLRDRLAQSIWRDDEIPAHIVDVRMRQRRQSRRGTTTLYTVVFNGADDKVVEQLYIGYECSRDALDAEYEAALSQATIAPARGRAVTVIPEKNLLLVAFPNDRRMRLSNEDALRAWLDRTATVLANRGRRGPAWRVKDAAFGILRYVPGQRLTLSCRGGFEAGGGLEQPFAFVAKQYKEPNLARSLHRNLVALDKHLSGSVWLPRPMAFDQDTGLVAMEELPGKDLMRSLPEIDVSQTMWNVGEMLATLHRAPRLVRKGVSVREKLEEVRQAAGRIERLFPAGLPRLTACVARCLTVRWTDDVPKVLLHGAFRPKHVFVHDGRLALIDVDGLRMGHPAHDVGHFLSALYYMEAQELLSAGDRRVAMRRFLEGYSARSPWRLKPAAVLWYTAAVLVHKQARKYVVHLHEDRAEKVDRVLRLAEEALAACQHLQPGTSLDVVDVVSSVLW